MILKDGSRLLTIDGLEFKIKLRPLINDYEWVVKRKQTLNYGWRRVSPTVSESLQGLWGRIKRRYLKRLSER
jgi:hypothetical protein